MAIDGASDPVVRLAIFQRQQPYDDVRRQREGSLWPTPWHHDRLTNSEPMSRHGGHLGWHRTDGNRLWPVVVYFGEVVVLVWCTAVEECAFLAKWQGFGASGVPQLLGERVIVAGAGAATVCT
jgi:hypothetical protein